MSQNRIPTGVPTGGQFAASQKDESGTSLADPNKHPAVLAAIAQAKTTGKPVRIADAPGVTSGGYDDGTGSAACGDSSLGNEPSNRATWATGNDNEPFITATATYFVTARRDGDDNDLDYDDWQEAEARLGRATEADQQADGIYNGIAGLTDNERGPANLDIDRLRRLAAGIRDEEGTVRYSIEHQTELLAHTDVSDPGSTEVRSDVQYGDGTSNTFTSVAAATDQAAAYARNEDWNDYYPENWKQSR